MTPLERKMTVLEYHRWLYEHIQKMPNGCEVVGAKAVTELVLSLIKEDERKGWQTSAVFCPVDFETGEG